MPIQHQDIWIETPGGNNTLSKLEKRRISGRTLIEPNLLPAPGVGVFKTERGHYVVFRQDGKFIGGPSLDIREALGQSPIGAEGRALIELYCEPPSTDLELMTLFERTKLSDDDIRQFRLDRMDAKAWKI